MYRGSLLKPKVHAHLPKKEIKRPQITTEVYQDALYRRYVENRLRPGLRCHQRRVLPSIAENAVTLNFGRVQKFAELEEAQGTCHSKPASIKTVYSATSVVDEYLDSKSEHTAYVRGDYGVRSDNYADARTGSFGSGSGDFADVTSKDLVNRKNVHTEELAEYL